MYQKKYKEILRRLMKNPIINPTDDDMARICPHLTREEAVNAFRNGNVGWDDSTYVACPGLRVRNAFQIVKFERARNDRPARIAWAYTGRINYGPEYRYATEAVKFAEGNWGKYLIDDNWPEVAEINILNPERLVKSKLYPGGQPETAMTITLALIRERGERFYDHSLTQSELFEKAIAEISIDPLISQEIGGHRNKYTYYFCGYCGSGFEPSFCPGCDKYFQQELLENHSSKMPLPRKLVAFAKENGHNFKKDPEIALRNELEGFSKNVYYYWKN